MTDAEKKDLHLGCHVCHSFTDFTLICLCSAMTDAEKKDLQLFGAEARARVAQQVWNRNRVRRGKWDV